MAVTLLLTSVFWPPQPAGCVPMSALRPLLPENDASYFPSATFGVTEPAKALPSVLVDLYNRWPFESHTDWISVMDQFY